MNTYDDIIDEASAPMSEKDLEDPQEEEIIYTNAIARSENKEENEIIKDLGMLNFSDSKPSYEIVSIIAFLIGVPAGKFFQPNTNLLPNTYKTLNNNRAANIVRNLCIVRNAIMLESKNITNQMKDDFSSFLIAEKYIPDNALNFLTSEGIDILNPKGNIQSHISNINKMLANRFNNCDNLFPDWLNRKYLKNMFFIAFTESSYDNASSYKTSMNGIIKYYQLNPEKYPYGCYIYWYFHENSVINILENDKVFVTELYRQNGSKFSQYGKVSEVSGEVKHNISSFINASNKIDFLVDCENSDPYKLIATIRSLNSVSQAKINKIILFDDVNASITWENFQDYVSIPVEHKMVDRIKERKSLVDIALVIRACIEFYQSNIDSFAIVSSDSDFWELIRSLKSANFMVMVEREQCSNDLKEQLSNANIFYCYLDDFNDDVAEKLKNLELIKSMQQYIKSNLSVNINIYDMLKYACKNTRISLSKDEEQRLISQHLKTMKLDISDAGDVSFVINV